MKKQGEDFLMKSKGKRKNTLINQLKRYYKIKDIDEGSSYLIIFKTLYLLESKLSYDEIAAKFFIDIKTLYRYRKRFNSLAEKLSKVK